MADEWGEGSYEETAAELAPVAEVAVAALGLSDGERVLDVACGTGNAAAVAAARGARVTGLDGSERLLEVARERVPGGEFVHGDAAQLPFEDGAFDAAVSVFGMIFAEPAERAAAEIARVVRPGGRVAITSWLPRGPLFPAIVLLRKAIARVRPPEGPPRADWGDRDVIARLLGPYGEVEIAEQALAPPDERGPEEIWERWERSHPMWIRSRRLLEPAGEWERLRAESIAAMGQAAEREGPASPYLLTVLRRGMRGSAP
jgi:SAM-dependent methyltransferase